MLLYVGITEYVRGLAVSAGFTFRSFRNHAKSEIFWYPFPSPFEGRKKGRGIGGAWEGTDTGTSNPGGTQGEALHGVERGAAVDIYYFFV
jgi:hypothetical protein